MAKVVILTGSNRGDRSKMLDLAAASISSTVGSIVARSHIYQSAPWGFESQHRFLNQLLVIETETAPEQLLLQTQQIELEMGRQMVFDGFRYHDRVIDIDIIFYDSLIMQTETLTIPHAQIAYRGFVLTPLAEIMPNFTHPIYKKTVAQLLAECADKDEVSRY